MHELMFQTVVKGTSERSELISCSIYSCIATEQLISTMIFYIMLIESLDTTSCCLPGRSREYSRASARQ